MYSLFKSNKPSRHVGVQVLADRVVVVIPESDGDSYKIIIENASKGLHAEALKKVVSDNKLNGCVANLVLSPQESKSYVVDEPPVPVEEQAEAAKWRVKDMLDFDVEAAVVGVFEYPKDALRGRAPQLNVRVAKSATVALQLEALNEAGLVPNQIVTADLALASLLLPQPEGSVASSVLLYLSKDYGMLVLVKNNQLYLAREFDFDFDALNEPAQQERKLNQLTLEVQRSFDYFESQMGSAPPKQVSLSAPSATLPLANMMGGALGVEVQNFSLSDQSVQKDVAGERPYARLQVGLYAFGALKAISNPAHTVNLYTDQFKPKKQSLTLVQLAVSSAAILLLIVSLSVWQSGILSEQKSDLTVKQTSVTELQDKVDALQSEFDGLTEDANLIALNEGLQNDIEAYRALLGELGSQEQAFSFRYSDLLTILARHKPEKLWLTNFGVESNNGRLHIDGETLDAKEITVFLESLQSEEILSRQGFGSLEVTAHEDREGHYTFSLKSARKEG